MKYLELETFSDFVCSGSECPFTCCGNGWDILIDDDTLQYYRSVTGDMGKRLLDNIKIENGKAYFIVNDFQKCPFLNEKGLCDIYINLGEEHLCNTCTYYPRYTYYTGDICFAGVSISCPEVVRFFLSHTDPLLIDYAEDELPVNQDGALNWELFNHSIRVFTTLVSIAQNRSLTIKERLSLIIMLVYNFQDHVNAGTDPSDIIRLFSSCEGITEILKLPEFQLHDNDSKIEFCSEMLSCFGSIEDYEKRLPELAQLSEFFRDPINSQISLDKWIKSFSWISDEENLIWLEQLLVYVLYRFFMQGFSTCDFSDKLFTGVGLIFCVCYCTISLYYVQNGKMDDMDHRILMISHITRIIEHSGNIRDMALAYFQEKGMTDAAFMLRLVS